MSQASSSPFAVRIKASAANTALPAWVPPEGQFANISLNTLYDVRPSGWPNSDVAGPFANWSGGTYAPDFSNLGAYVVHGSGHLVSGTALWAGVWCFDLDTLRWTGRNVPNQPLLENAAAYDSYGQSTVAATLGHPYPPHTYDGLVYQPPAKGGGAQGSLLRASMAGSQWGSALHRFDLSSSSAPPTRVVDTIQGGFNYPAAASDDARSGMWYLAGNGNGPLKFISFGDWSVKSFPGVEINIYGDMSLIYIPAPWDCLVTLGREGSGGVNYSARVSRIVNNVPQPFSNISYIGTPPGDLRAGGVWSTLLNCIVSYEAGGSNKVHKLTPPAPASVGSGGWSITTETLVGVNGVLPSKCSAGTNGAWGRFIEVPAARCFIWCDSVNQPVQAWRLTGM